ncbi:MAG: DUF1570 domain-containing protein [Planctomycetota bacterium]
MKLWRVVLMLAALAALACDSLAQELYDVESRRYAITTNLERDEIIEVATHMDAVFDAYTGLLSGFRERNTKPVRLYIVRTREQYRELLREKGIDGTNSGGMFFASGSGAGLATWHDGRTIERVLGVLRHEGFHQFAHLRIDGNFPVWANEGLAEYFEASVLVRDRLEMGLVPASRLAEIQNAIREGETLPFDEFLKLDGATWNERLRGGDVRTGMMYTQSWSVVHFLLHGDDGKYASAFELFIRETARGMSVDNALRNAFRTSDYAAFEDAWKWWTLELEPDALSTARERLSFLARGIEWLDERDVAVSTIDELRVALRERGFRLRERTASGVREFDAADDTLFEAPAPDRRGRESAIEMVASDREGEPRSVRITGLRARVGVVWSRDDEGALTHRIVFE